MQSIQALRERLAASSKAANHILAEKGGAVWTKEDQAQFDGHVDEAERIKAQIAAHEKMIAADAETNFTDVQTVQRGKKLSDKQRGIDIFLRKSFKEMSAEEVQMVRNTMSTTTAAQGGNTMELSLIHISEPTRPCH
jgi:HK97 family phage major capsid protein